MAIVQVGYGMAKFAFPSLHHASLRPLTNFVFIVRLESVMIRPWQLPAQSGI